jgi:WD40 repeat protein
VSTEVETPKATGNPYVGPQSFRRGDAFYGRDRETADLLDLLIAERVVLLYSPSGAGKSSLIAAGLVRQLEAEGFEVLPVVRLTHEPPPGSSLSGPPRNRYTLSTLLSLDEGLPTEHQHGTAELDPMTVTEYLANWPDLDNKPGNEVLLFDQFEEVLTADPNDHAAKEQFFGDIGVALRDRNLWALFAIREDFLAELDPYTRFMPTRFANRYRLDLLGVDQALDAMILPAADRGADFKRPAAEKLVDDLRRIRVQRADGLSEELGPTVEPVQLQVACRQIWNRLAPDAKSIDVDDVEALGSVDQALASYYADCVAAAAAETGVSERALRDWFENELVTPQGIRGQVLYGPRQNGAFSDSAVRMLTTAHLVRAESRRGATWYELAHDRLIEPVQEDNARWREQNLSYFERLASWWDEQNRPDQALLSGPDLANAEAWVAANAATLSPREHDFFEASRKAAQQAEQDRRATRRTRRFLVIAVIGCVLAAGFAAWGWRAQRETVLAANRFEVSALAGKARDELESDVDLSLLLAQRAVELPLGSATNQDVRNALQMAVDQSPVVMVLRGHGTAANAVYSPDGRFIATYHDDDKSIVVWDAQSGAELYTLTAEDGLVNAKSVVFSPDSARLAAVANDGRVAIWPAREDAGEPTWLTPQGDTSAWQVAFSPDGQRIASLGTVGLAVVDDSGQTARSFDAPDAVAMSGIEVEWTPDGERLVAGDEEGIVSVWDADTGQRLHADITHPSGIVALDVSPDGKTVASVSNNAVLVSRLADGGTDYSLDRGGLTGVAFNSDGSQVAVIDQWGTVVVIDLASGATLRAITASGMTPRSLDFDPTDNGRAVVATGTGAPAIWDVSALHSDYEVAIETLPDGGVLSASADGSVFSWTADGAARQLRFPGDRLQDAAVTPDGALVAVALDSGVVEAFRSTDGETLTSQSLGDSSAWAVALSPDGRSVTAGGSDGRVVVWQVPGGEEISTLNTHTDGVVALDYGADATELVSASRDETAIIWDLDSAEPDKVLRLGTRATAVSWSDDGKTIAVGGEDGSVQFWDPATGQQLAKETEHAKAVTDVAFDPSGAVLVSASDDRSLITWDTSTGQFETRVRQGTAPWRLAVASDGDRVVVADNSGAPHVVFLDGNELLAAAQAQATRELTDAECERVFRDDECPGG